MKIFIFAETHEFQEITTSQLFQVICSTGIQKINSVRKLVEFQAFQEPLINCSKTVLGVKKKLCMIQNYNNKQKM